MKNFYNSILLIKKYIFIFNSKLFIFNIIYYIRKKEKRKKKK